MRLLIGTESFLPRVNGVTGTVTALTAHLRERGHEALVVAAGDGPTEHDGFPVVRVLGVRGLFYPDLTVTPLAPGMTRLVRAFAPDLVHLASPATLGPHLARAARRARVPIVAHYQTDLVAYGRAYGGPMLAAAAARVERRVHNRFDATYAPTEAMAGELRRRGIERVAVSGRGVDSVRFRPDRPGAAAAARWWPEGGSPRVLCVARLAREKGLERLVELALRHEDLSILLVGDGPCRAALTAAAPPNLRLTGTLQGDALADVYAGADLFAYPSTTETFGQVVQEALSSGLPVVGVRAGGVATLVDHGVTGVLVERQADLAAAVASLGSDPARCAAMGVRARRATLAQHSWAAVFDALLDDYRSHLRRPSSPAPATAPPRPGRRRAAFFDVDRTVIRGSCFLAMARPLAQAGALSRRTLVRAGIRQLWFTLRGAPQTRLDAAARAGVATVAGMEAATLRRIGESAMAAHVLPRIFPEARRAVRRHRDAGDLVFLVSSAPAEIVAGIAAALDADGYAATRAEVRAGVYTGRLLEFCHGFEKVRAVRRLARRHGVDLASSVAYADSASDLALLQAVGRAVCVNPDSRLRAEARRRGWEVMRFRPAAQYRDLRAEAPAAVAEAQLSVGSGR